MGEFFMRCMSSGMVGPGVSFKNVWPNMIVKQAEKQGKYNSGGGTGPYKRI